MADKDLSEMSVADLNRILNERQSRVNKLKKKRDSYLEKVQGLEDQIHELEGEGAGAGTGTRPRNEKPLHDYVTDILGRHKKGLALADLAEKVLKAGYKTNSSNFNNTVYQCVYKSDEIDRDEKSGNYVIA